MKTRKRATEPNREPEENAEHPKEWKIPEMGKWKTWSLKEGQGTVWKAHILKHTKLEEHLKSLMSAEVKPAQNVISSDHMNTTGWKLVKTQNTCYHM